MQSKTIKIQSNKIEIHFFHYCKEKKILMENAIYRISSNKRPRRLLNFETELRHMLEGDAN